MKKTKLGAYVRREREAKNLTLRMMAAMLGVSPTYMSKVERSECAPPTEDRIRAIAQILERDPDVLLAMAGRVPSDLAEIIKRHPVEVAAMMRKSDFGLG